MIAYNFHAAGNGASGSADAGHWELVQQRQEALRPAPHTFRAAHTSHVEQLLIDRFATTLGDTCPRELAVSLYVALKTSPLVIINGPPGAGKARLVERFANALFGLPSEQFVTIGSGSWAQYSGEHHYYQSVHERFGSLHLLEMLHEAAAPENSGKAFLLHLKGPTPEDLDHYFGDLLQITPDGQLHLALPGMPATGNPVLPQNVLITATIHSPGPSSERGQRIVQQAAQINLGTARIPPSPPPALPLVPVGLQRALLTYAIRDVDSARERLLAIFGRSSLRSMFTTAFLRAIFWPERRALTTSSAEALLFLANSFDSSGAGLFDPSDPRQNAQIACAMRTAHQRTCPLTLA